MLKQVQVTHLLAYSKKYFTTLYFQLNVIYNFKYMKMDIFNNNMDLHLFKIGDPVLFLYMYVICKVIICTLV